LIDRTIDALAEAVHATYVRRYPSARSWEELDEETRELSRRQAEHTYLKLAMTNCRLVPLPAGRESPFRFDDREVEEMARFEHERWAIERLAAGWEHGAERDRHAKLHPDLTSWDDLPPEQQEANCEFVRLLPSAVARLGLQIERCG
jgi:hypothetical protein